jgi:hypothetical protein
MNDEIIDYRSLHCGLSKERCIEILKESGHLVTGPWFSLVNLHRIPRGLSAQDTERFLREQGALANDHDLSSQRQFSPLLTNCTFVRISDSPGKYSNSFR